MSSMAVAVVNHNTRVHLRACLATVDLEASDEVVVVDNASTDGSVEMVQAEYPHMMLYANRTNSGYGAAGNQAIANCRAPLILLLNSDTLLQPGTLQALVTYLDRHPQVAVVGPRLVYPNGTLQPSCFHFPTPFNILLEQSRLGPVLPSVPIIRDHYLPTWSHDQPRVVPWVLGAVLAIRREAFEAVKGFDESYFMYYEEVDLCYRLQAAGWQTHYAPVTTVVHGKGASTSQRDAEMANQVFASLIRFYRRHYSPLQRVALTALIISFLIRDTIRLKITRETEARATLEGAVAKWQHVFFEHVLRPDTREKRHDHDPVAHF